MHLFLSAWSHHEKHKQTDALRFISLKTNKIFRANIFRKLFLVAMANVAPDWQSCSSFLLLEIIKWMKHQVTIFCHCALCIHQQTVSLNIKRCVVYAKNDIKYFFIVLHSRIKERIMFPFKRKTSQNMCFLLFKSFWSIRWTKIYLITYEREN